MRGRVGGECPHKRPVTRKMYPFENVIIIIFAQYKNPWKYHEKLLKNDINFGNLSKVYEKHTVTWNHQLICSYLILPQTRGAINISLTEKINGLNYVRGKCRRHTTPWNLLFDVPKSCNNDISLINDITQIPTFLFLVGFSFFGF